MEPTHGRGFTLHELLIGVATLAVFAAFAIPSWLKFIDSNRRATEVNRFISTIQLARSEALRRGRTVVVCPSADSTNCGDRGEWRVGWLAHPEDRPETVLMVHRVGSQRDITANRDRFLVRPPHRRSTNGTVTFCGRHGAAPRAVVVGLIGRPRLDDRAEIESRC